LIENAAVQGDRLRDGLNRLQQHYECLGDIRGLGLMQAAELVKDRHTKTPDKALRDKLLQGCFKKGLLLLSCGDSVIRFCPPLIISPDDTAVALDIFESVLKDALSSQ
jgi:4-aminobutyrate aminotransferase